MAINDTTVKGVDEERLKQLSPRQLGLLNSYIDATLICRAFKREMKDPLAMLSVDTVRPHLGSSLLYTYPLLEQEMETYLAQHPASPIFTQSPKMLAAEPDALKQEMKRFEESLTTRAQAKESNTPILKVKRPRMPNPERQQKLALEKQAAMREALQQLETIQHRGRIDDSEIAKGK